MKVAELENTIDASETSFTYLNGSTNFLTMDPSVATFYIRITDPENPGSDEIMLVTGHTHVGGVNTLIVTRGQQGTTAVTHNLGSAIQTYTGVRDEVIIGLFRFPDTTMVQGLKDFGQKNPDGTYLTMAYFMYHQDMFPTRDASGTLAYYDEVNDDWRTLGRGTSTSPPTPSA